MAVSIPPPDFFPSDHSSSRASFGPEGIEERYKSGIPDGPRSSSSDASSSSSWPRSTVPPPARPKCGLALAEPAAQNARRGWPAPGVDPRQNAIACIATTQDPEAAQRSLQVARDELVAPLADAVIDLAREAATLQYPAYPLQTNIDLGEAYRRARQHLPAATQQVLERDGLDHHGTSMMPTFDFLFSATHGPRLQARISAALPADLGLTTYNVGGFPISSVFVDIRPTKKD